ncbi:LLM class flavin-dependent oxidoreductase [Achromobacter marplatensis]|uniref:LLM class flavin-dependent oxidoreductase n=1 Tax=Achromobacter marplatensis TaxID=470868 RepID=UPI003C72270C
MSSQTKEGLRKLVAEVRESVAREGRSPRDIKFFMGVTAVVGRTEAEAREKHAEYLRYANPEAGAGALRKFNRHRFFALRRERADPVREEQCDRVGG